MNRKKITVKKKKVIIGLSGGIDSAASASLLKSEGYEVIGVTFNFLSSEQTITAAKKVAENLQIEHHVLEAQNQFRKNVILPFIDAYKNGETPNPCMLCNQTMKFPLLCDFAKINDQAAIATGHYAEVKKKDDSYELWASPNARKDQSYFLYHLNQEVLKKLIFPLNAFESKNQVRGMIKKLLPELSKGAESQGICFIPKKGHQLFLKQAIFGSQPAEAGIFVDSSGKILGRHKGIQNFTLGQTRGLGLLSNTKWAVVGLEPQTNTVVLDDEQVLFKDRIFVDQLFVHPHVDLTKQEFSFKTCRWGHIYRGQIERLPGNQAIVHSRQSVRAPAPGQALVFYQGRRVLGGGIIKHFEFR